MVGAQRRTHARLQKRSGRQTAARTVGRVPEKAVIRDRARSRVRQRQFPLRLAATAAGLGKRSHHLRRAVGAGFQAAGGRAAVESP